MVEELHEDAFKKAHSTQSSSMQAQIELTELFVEAEKENLNSFSCSMKDEKLSKL